MAVKRCAWKRCRRTEILLTYLDKPLCARHWLRLCELQEAGRDDQARKMIGLRPRRRAAKSASIPEPEESPNG